MYEQIRARNPCIYTYIHASKCACVSMHVWHVYNLRKGGAKTYDTLWGVLSFQWWSQHYSDLKGNTRTTRTHGFNANVLIVWLCVCACVCMCVNVCVCVCVCVYMCMRACICVRMRVCVWERVYECECVCVCVYVRACVCPTHLVALNKEITRTLEWKFLCVQVCGLREVSSCVKEPFTPGKEFWTSTKEPWISAKRDLYSWALNRAHYSLALNFCKRALYTKRALIFRKRALYLWNTDQNAIHKPPTQSAMRVSNFQKSQVDLEKKMWRLINSAGT